jgi:hypothetical protein
MMPRRPLECAVFIGLCASARVHITALYGRHLASERVRRHVIKKYAIERAACVRRGHPFSSATKEEPGVTSVTPYRVCDGM